MQIAGRRQWLRCGRKRARGNAPASSSFAQHASGQQLASNRAEQRGDCRQPRNGPGFPTDSYVADSGKAACEVRMH